MSGNNLEYYILDSETTGLQAGYHEVVQLSIIRAADKFQRSFNIKAEFPYRASKESLAITGKTVWDLQKGIPKSEAAEQIDEFLCEDNKTNAHRVIVAHNSSFDRRHLHATWDSLNKPFLANLWLCTMAFMRKYTKAVGVQKIASAQGTTKVKYGLEQCLTALKLPIKSGAHNAIIDTQNCLTLFKHLMQQNIGHVQLIQSHPHQTKNEPIDYDLSDAY